MAFCLGKLHVEELALANQRSIFTGSVNSTAHDHIVVHDEATIEHHVVLVHLAVSWHDVSDPARTNGAGAIELFRGDGMEPAAVIQQEAVTDHLRSGIGRDDSRARNVVLATFEDGSVRGVDGHDARESIWHARGRGHQEFVAIEGDA